MFNERLMLGFGSKVSVAGWKIKSTPGKPSMQVSFVTRAREVELTKTICSRLELGFNMALSS